MLGDELDSPRGRIYLIKEMLENDRPATAEVAQHIDRCLSCLACMSTCPSGVHYQHLIDHARMHVERTYRRPWADRALRAVLAAVLPYPRRFRAALALAAAARPLAPVLPRRVRAMLVLAARKLPASAALGEPAAVERPRARLALVTGCVQDALAPDINAATVRLLRRSGAEVVAIAGCCGSIVHHLGKEQSSHALAAELIERLHAEIERGIDAIVVNASGCGTQVKDYGYIFRNDAQLAAKAAAVSAKARDVSEVVAELGLPPVVRRLDAAVAYHSACSMQHGQKLHAAPRALLASAGFDVRDVAEGHLCCGSAGTYNVLQPEIAAALRTRKLDNIAKSGAALVATGNIGCITQLGGQGGAAVVHTVQLLDWATGGPAPAGIADETGGARPPESRSS